MTIIRWAALVIVVLGFGALGALHWQEERRQTCWIALQAQVDAITAVGTAGERPFSEDQIKDLSRSASVDVAKCKAR